MDISLIILTIIIIIIIIICISLISYNMYKVNKLNNEVSNIDSVQNNIISFINKKESRFSDSIFINNIKNFFIIYNTYMIKNIYSKICIKNIDILVECDNNNSNKAYSDSDLDIEKLNKDFEEIWKLIIEIIKNIEVVFYKKLTQNEITTHIKNYTSSLKQYIEYRNRLPTKKDFNIVLSNIAQIIEIYFTIFFEIVINVVANKEVQDLLYNQFSNEIEKILYTSLHGNMDNLSTFLYTNTTDDNGDISSDLSEFIYYLKLFLSNTIDDTKTKNEENMKNLEETVLEKVGEIPNDPYYNQKYEKAEDLAIEVDDKMRKITNFL
jgi:hypothetical protein